MSVTETVTYEPDKTATLSAEATQATNHERIGRDGSSTSSAMLSQLHLIPSSVKPQQRTRFTQEAKITALCGGWKKIREKVEEATIERFAENAKRGREGFEAVLETSRRVFGEEKERERIAAAQGGGGAGR